MKIQPITSIYIFVLLDVTCYTQELELGDKLQSLKESEWQKRVALERENTQLQEKVAAHERFITICTYSVIHTSIRT